MLKIVRITRHLLQFFYQKEELYFFETLPFFQKTLIFLKIATYFRYFYIYNNFFLFQIENFRAYVASRRAL